MPLKITTLVCDDVRVEAGNKLSVMGIYPNGIFFGDISESNPLLYLPSLALYGVIEGLTASTTFEFKLITPKGEVLMDMPPQPLDATPNQGITNFFAKLGSLVFPSFGMYQLIIKIGDQIESLSFPIADHPKPQL